MFIKTRRRTPQTWDDAQLVVGQHLHLGEGDLPLDRTSLRKLSRVVEASFAASVCPAVRPVGADRGLRREGFPGRAEEKFWTKFWGGRKKCGALASHDGTGSYIYGDASRSEQQFFCQK